MKAIVLMIQLSAAMMLYSSALQASGGHDRGHHKGHHKHHHYHPEEAGYYPPPQYPRHEDRRSTEGLVGGAAGSAIGYEIGNGNPLAAGIGAAAGSYLGNEIAEHR